MDYVYYMELPDDITPERLLELGSNFEYRYLRNFYTTMYKMRGKKSLYKQLTFCSNFQERRVVRYLAGDLTIRLCSGIFHRIDTIKQAAEKYDYDPYLVTKPGEYR
jgi:vacuolar protein sorting-associated protein 13B